MSATPLAEPATARRGARLLVHLLAVYALLYAGHAYSIDGMVTYQQAKRIAFHRSVVFEPPIEWAGARFATSLWDEGLTLAYLPALTLLGGVVFRDDRSFRDVPARLPDLPKDPSFRWVGWVNALATALTALLLRCLALVLGLTEPRARAIALVFALASPALVYQKQDFAQPLAGLFLTRSVLAWIGARTATEPSVRDRALLVLGGALGLLVASRSEWALLAVLPLLATASVRRRLAGRARDVAIVLAALVPLLVAHLAFGSLEQPGAPLGARTGDLFAVRSPAALLLAAAGLVFSPARGLVACFPLALFAPWGLRRMADDGQRALAAIVAIVATASIALFASWKYWPGGHSWGPRFLVPLLPLLTLAALWPPKARGRGATIAIGVASVAGLLTALAGALPFPQLATACAGRPSACFDPALHPLVTGSAALLRPRDYDLLMLRDGGAGLPPSRRAGAGALLVVAVLTAPAAYGKARTEARKSSAPRSQV